MAPSIVTVQLATVVIASVLYGWFLTLFVVTFQVARSRHRRAKLFVHLWSPSILASLGLLVTVTGHWISLVYRAFQAFVLYDSGLSATEFFNDLTQYSERFTNSFLVATFLIWDSVLIYRTWIVWDRNFLVILIPCCAYMGHVVTGVRVVYMLAKTGDGKTFFYSDVAPWLTSYAALICGTNVYCTVVIAWRIWSHDRKTKHLFGQRSISSGFLGIFIESALVYTIWNILYIFIYAFKSPMEFFMLNVWVPLAGISYVLILLRVSLGQGYAARMSSSTTPGTLTNITRADTHTSMDFETSNYFLSESIGTKDHAHTWTTR